MIACGRNEVRMRGAYAIAAGLLLAPGMAAAAPFAYFCAAPLSHSSQMMQVQPGPTYRVRGRIGPVELERIPDPSLPVPIEAHTQRYADVMIMNFETGRSVWLTVTPRYPGTEPESVADVEVQTGIDDQHGSHQLTTLGSRGFLWDELPFDIEVRADRVIVTAGAAREEYAITVGPGATIYLSCIGGSFDFQGVEWNG
jgi:hypothetical protein